MKSTHPCKSPFNKCEKLKKFALYYTLKNELIGYFISLNTKNSRTRLHSLIGLLTSGLKRFPMLFEVCLVYNYQLIYEISTIKNRYFFFN